MHFNVLFVGQNFQGFNFGECAMRHLLGIQDDSYNCDLVRKRLLIIFQFLHVVLMEYACLLAYRTVDKLYDSNTILTAESTFPGSSNTVRQDRKLSNVGVKKIKYGRY